MQIANLLAQEYQPSIIISLVVLMMFNYIVVFLLLRCMVGKLLKQAVKLRY